MRGFLLLVFLFHNYKRPYASLNGKTPNEKLLELEHPTPIQPDVITKYWEKEVEIKTTKQQNVLQKSIAFCLTCLEISHVMSQLYSYSWLKWFFILLPCLIPCLCCNSRVGPKVNNWLTTDSIEVVDLHYSFYDSPSNTFKNPILGMTQRIWRRGTLVIEECKSVIGSKNEIGDEYQIEYRFNDLKTMMAYTFRTFSDTAEILERYSLNDTIPRIGGWGFGYKPRYATPIGISVKLPDTTIDKIEYGRYRVSMKRNNEVQFYTDCLTRCEKKGTLFSFKEFAQGKIACPIVRVYSFSQSNSVTPSSGTVDFLRNSLSGDEERIFKAWEKKVKEMSIKE